MEVITFTLADAFCGHVSWEAKLLELY